MIGFSAPWLLLALPVAGLPLLLHLVRRHEPPELAFPAVRYLADATRDQRHRLRLRHLLLLAVRTLLLLVVVLAAAGLQLTRGGVGGHAPSALVLVVDNSASSGVIVDGAPLLSALVRAADAVLARATTADLLWLATADGPAIPGSPAQLRQRLTLLRPTTTRLDLGVAIRSARDIVGRAGRPGEVVVVSDLQRSAVTAASGDVPLLLLRPSGPPPTNRRIAVLSAGPQPWGQGGGVVRIAAAGADTTPLVATLAIGERPPRDLVLVPGVPTLTRVGAGSTGWTTLRALLPPDEFRLDDEREIALRVAPPVAVQWNIADRFVNAALSVLVSDGRAIRGSGVTVAELGPGPSIVVPPEDPALLGTLNRRLAARGAAWQFGAPLRLEERSDSGALLAAREPVSRRVRLERVGGVAEVLATVSGEPWLVQSGDLVILGSRLEPGWTALPLGTAFVTLLDALIGRASGGEVPLPEAVAGVPIRLPERVSAVAHAGRIERVEGGGHWSPPAVGVYHLLVGEDTLGAVSVVLDPRESEFARAADGMVRTLWGRTTALGLDEGPRRAFTAGGRRDLRGALLLLALLCACAEVGLASRAGQRT